MSTIAISMGPMFTGWVLAPGMSQPILGGAGGTVNAAQPVRGGSGKHLQVTHTTTAASAEPVKLRGRSRLWYIDAPATRPGLLPVCGSLTFLVAGSDD